MRLGLPFLFNSSAIQVRIESGRTAHDGMRWRCGVMRPSAPPAPHGGGEAPASGPGTSWQPCAACCAGLAMQRAAMRCACSTGPFAVYPPHLVNGGRVSKCKALGARPVGAACSHGGGVVACAPRREPGGRQPPAQPIWGSLGTQPQPRLCLHHEPAQGHTDGATTAPTAPMAPLRRKIVIFEVAGGSDKGPDGHRKDTMPIVAALRARGWEAEVLFYSDAERGALTAHALAAADAFLMRVNPGSYPGFTESEFLAMGRELHARGCHALTHPDVMLSYGAKDSLVKLRDTPTGLPDTCCYYNAAGFMATFPGNLAKVRGAKAGGYGRCCCSNCGRSSCSPDNSRRVGRSGDGSFSSNRPNWQQGPRGHLRPARVTAARPPPAGPGNFQSDRVLKQNRGSAGEGIWVVKPHGWRNGPGQALPGLGALVSATEMKDNSHHIFKLGEFMERCLEYIEGVSGAGLGPTSGLGPWPGRYEARALHEVRGP
jgi:hypothetical protein